MPEAEKTPRLLWDQGTAYDLFASLLVIHTPGEYGLRPSWAAGIRSRLSPGVRDVFAALVPFTSVPLLWLYGLPGAKNARTALDLLESMKPEEILPAITFNPRHHEKMDDLLRSVLERGAWEQADLDACCSLMETHFKNGEEKARSTAKLLDAWADPARFGAAWRAGIREFYEVFYREEERRILPDLEKSMARARDMAERLPVAQLFEELSQGISIDFHRPVQTLILIPCWWCSPRIIYTALSDEEEIVLFGARPATASLIPGDMVPSALLLALEALSDPSRLSILRTLIAEPLTQADIARRLRLRPPTISHHLKALRIAGLIAYLGSEKGETRYRARISKIEQTCAALKDFLEIRTPG